ncbi:hypothetical protein C0995_003928 [Termitomyces sp. Mi166|nr:hypothetical protein C0995_003928 [Termitomyces sp. Mi166\
MVAHTGANAQTMDQVDDISEMLEMFYTTDVLPDFSKQEQEDLAFYELYDNQTGMDIMSMSMHVDIGDKYPDQDRMNSFRFPAYPFPMSVKSDVDPWGDILDYFLVSDSDTSAYGHMHDALEGFEEEGIKNVGVGVGVDSLSKDPDNERDMVFVFGKWSYRFRDISLNNG